MPTTVQWGGEWTQGFIETTKAWLANHFKEFVMASAKKVEAIKWDRNPLWHIVNNDKCLHVTEKLELLWSHSFKEVEIIASNFLRKKTTFKSVYWEVLLIKVLFLAFVR